VCSYPFQSYLQSIVASVSKYGVNKYGVNKYGAMNER
jgi:hypothetical protein